MILIVFIYKHLFTYYIVLIKCSIKWIIFTPVNIQTVLLMCVRARTLLYLLNYVIMCGLTHTDSHTLHTHTQADTDR